MAYSYLIIGLLLVALGGFLILRVWRKSDPTDSINLQDILLVWPAIFKLDRRAKRPTSKKFVVIGVALSLLIVVLAVKYA